MPAFLLFLAVGFCGCVERKLFIKSDPPGATVFVDGTKRGMTPLEFPFIYYGERDLELRLGGYRVHREMIELDPPWFQIFPFDLFCEAILPFRWEDFRVIERGLTPFGEEESESREEVFERAKELRRNS